jgi:hypothetical protein
MRQALKSGNVIAPEITAGAAGSFAREVFHRRHPLLVAWVSAGSTGPA